MSRVSPSLAKREAIAFGGQRGLRPLDRFEERLAAQLERLMVDRHEQRAPAASAIATACSGVQ